MCIKKLINVVIGSILFGALFCSLALAQEQEETAKPVIVTEEETLQKELILPAGTPLDIVLAEELYSQRNEVGDEVLFFLKNDVIMMGRTYLVKGTPILGRVFEKKTAKSKGRSGSVDVTVNSILPPYGMPILLTEQPGTQYGKAGDDERQHVVVVQPNTVGSSLGLAIASTKKGEKVRIPAGTEMTIFTTADGIVLDIPSVEMLRLTDEWLRNKIVDNFLSFSWNKECTVKAAFLKEGFTITNQDILIEPINDYEYKITVNLSSEVASFSFRPFENVHPGGQKFKPLNPENEIAKEIMKNVK